MKNRLRYILFFIILATVGCSAQKDSASEEPSLAPVTPPTPPVDISGENNFRFAQTAATSGGWTLTYDSADSAQQVVLPSGWVVEVKYE